MSDLLAHRCVVLSLFAGLGACAAPMPGAPGCELCDEEREPALVSGADVPWAACGLEAKDDGFGPVHELSCVVDPRTVGTDGQWAELNSLSATLVFDNGEVESTAWLRGSEPTLRAGVFHDHFDNNKHPFPGVLRLTASSPGGETFERSFAIESAESEGVAFTMPFDAWDVAMVGSAEGVRRVTAATSFAFDPAEGVTYQRAYADSALVPAAIQMKAGALNAVRVPPGFDGALEIESKIYRRGADTETVLVEVAGPGVYDVAPAESAGGDDPE